MTKQDYYIEESILKNLRDTGYIASNEYEGCIKDLKEIYLNQGIIVN